VAAWGSYSYSFGPFIAVLGIGLLALLLRWTFRRPPRRPGRRRSGCGRDWPPPASAPHSPARL